MFKVDLRIFKKQLRTQMRTLRQEMSPALRQEKNRLIFERVVRLPQYQAAKTIITYVSSELEVDTRRLIERALSEGKRVAVPRCIPGTRTMEMYYIRSFADLSPGSFQILEPQPTQPKCTRWEHTLCIVPAFCNDKKGYRLGYGGGYYDRFLSQYTGVTLGINYSECVRDEMQHGRYDIPIQHLMTERYFLSFPHAKRRQRPRPKRTYKTAGKESRTVKKRTKGKADQ